MLIQELKLKDIRSYLAETIVFPQGKVLLAGDIGSGKSTILLAIEFALFGLIRGDVDGTALLRNGAREGSVQLTFLLDKPYTIFRSLKRTKDSVTQDEGWLETNGAREVGTATELRAKVLDLLGYPKSFLTKSKSFLFRYTVFTPQEEMKRILLDDKDARLETLRRVFDVDKYRRVKENAGIYCRTLREKKKWLEGITQDTETKRQMLRLKEEEIKAIDERIIAAAQLLDRAKTAAVEAKNKAVAVQQTITASAQLRAELSAAKQAVVLHEQAFQRAQQELQKTHATLTQIGPVDVVRDLAQIRADVTTLSEKVANGDKAIRESLQALAQASAAKNISAELVAKIAAIDSCPTCLQTVTPSHKGYIAKTEQEKIAQWETHASQHANAKQQWESFVLEAKQQLDAARAEEQKAIFSVAKQKTIASMHEQLQRQTEAQQHAKEQSLLAQQKVHVLEPQVAQLIVTEAAQKEVLAAADKAAQQERVCDVQLNRLAQERSSVFAFAETIKKEVAEKEKARQELERVQKVHGWLTDHFVNVMDVIERHVLSRAYQQFNGLFREWFSMLIEDDLLTARLDETFTPVISQNGYDVDITNLSGGEKTACALAYRLALNKVINDIVHAVNTKDLLILDEPTDGFSSEQLDKVRDVLDQLQLKQVIVVSHEAKIESMVDAVLRVQKEGHASKVVS